MAFKFTVWVYSETDGDAGEYGIKIFSTKEGADLYKKMKADAYGHIEKYDVEDYPTGIHES